MHMVLIECKGDPKKLSWGIYLMSIDYSDMAFPKLACKKKGHIKEHPQE